MLLLVQLALMSSFLSVWPDKGAPEPIEGVAAIKGDQFHTVVGYDECLFDFPAQWGLGDYSVTPDGKGHFVFFPKKGGLGCTLDIEYCSDQNLLKNRMVSLEKSFHSITPLKEGFEVKMEGAYFFCKTEGSYLIQMWYVTPYTTPDDQLSWEALKQCFTLLDQKTAATQKISHTRLSEGAGLGWWCHPYKCPYDLLFETAPSDKVKPNLGGVKQYYLEFDTTDSTGFFYIKSNVSNLDKAKSYKDHLKLIDEEIKKIEPSQKTDPLPEVDLNNRYAKLKGQPYQLVTLAGDGFLFGFAVKPKKGNVKPDLDKLIHRIKWKAKKG